MVAGQKATDSRQDPAGGDHSALLIYGSEDYINVAGTAEICNNEVDDDGDGLGDFEMKIVSIQPMEQL